MKDAFDRTTSTRFETNLLAPLRASVFATLHAAVAGDVTVGTLNGQGIFLQNGMRFIPRGVNVDTTGYDDANGPTGYHGTFDPCIGGRVYPACYGDGSQAEANLRYIHGSISGSVFSYNYVRVFLNSIYVNDGFTYTAVSNATNVYAAGPGVAPPNTIPGAWLSNIADFLQRAHNNGLRVILTGEYRPANFSYAPISCTDKGVLYSPCSSGENDVIFDPNYAVALGLFYSTLLSDLSSPPYSTNWPSAISAIMAFDVKNEGQVESNLMPLSNTALTALHIDNSVYDMSQYGPNGSRQLLIDDLTKNFVNTVGQAVRSADPSHSILVTSSVTAPYDNNGEAGYDGADPNPAVCAGTCTSFPLRSDIMALYGRIDFRDIHSYAYNGVNDIVPWQSAGLTSGSTNPVPLLMGEYGALRQSVVYSSAVYANEQTAVSAMQAHLSSSCAYGFGGWGLWTWMPFNSASSNQGWDAIFYNQNGSENNGVNGGLSIQGWPNVCQ